MKIEVYSRVEKHERKPARFVSDDAHLGVRLELDDGSVIDIHPIGDFVDVREVDGRTLIVEPAGANTIAIGSRPHR